MYTGFKAGGKHESRILAGYYVFYANILFTFQAIKNLSAPSHISMFWVVLEIFW